jgi:predicted enzyme related to lactoylglutathione lyase
MTDMHGSFVWYDLMTTDIEAAKAFYGSVAGWGAKPADDPNLAYTLFTLGETPVGGLMELTDQVRQQGVPPCWTGYIGVDDVDAAVARIGTLGGATRVPAQDIPHVGRFAVMADPQGAVFALFKWADGMAPPVASMETPGAIAWRELTAKDWQAAFEFYSTMFGWQKAEAFDMGPMGMYQLFSHGGQSVGGMFNKPPEMPGPFWLYYIQVENIDAAGERVKAGGGAILNGPMEVPGGWIVQCKDPQGAAFALHGPRNA